MSSNGHGATIPPVPSHQEVARDALIRYRDIGSTYWAAVAVLGLLSALGLIAFIIRWRTDGFEDRSLWGYHAATMSFLVTCFAAAPVVAAGLRFTQNNWRRPLTRIAEIYGITGMLVLLFLLPALATLPPMEGRTEIWFDWPQWAPFGWNVVIYATFALAGLAFLWTAALPDLAAARDFLPASRRQQVVRFLALGWSGHVRQWRVHRLGLFTLGAFYVLMFMLIQTLLSSEFSAGLLPGLKDAIYPASQVISSLQAGTGLVLITMFVMRRVGYERYFQTDQFWALSKPLLGFSLLWFYFWWSSFLTFWYGRQPAEINLIQLLYLGPYRSLFITSFFLNFLGPLLALIWNPVRRSVWGPAMVGAGVVVGALINQIRLFVAPFSVENPAGHILETIPPGQFPGFADILIVIGGISGAVLMFMLVSKIIPVIAIWEVGEGLRLMKVRRFLNRQVRVIAKSH